MTERLLATLGVDAMLVDSVFGDLAEERAERSARHGKVLAGLWCVEQIARSTPHLLVSAYRFGGPAARVRFSVALGLVAIATAGVGAAIALRDGPPARIVTDLANAADGIVVNKMKPVQLPMRVLDKRGHRLESEPVQFAWVSGAKISISPTGEVTCGIVGDAIVRVSSGAASADVPVRCRPVERIETSSWVDLVEGDPPTSLTFTAIGLNGKPVLQLRGAIRIDDSTVAAYDGSTVRPKQIGRTLVWVDVGDRTSPMPVIVHERVDSFESLRPDQHNVAMSVRLARGDTIHRALPPGVFWIKYLPRRATETPPTIAVEGPINCSAGEGIKVYRMALEEYGKYCIARPGASVLVAHGPNGLPIVEGSLLLQRLSSP
jgi:hypothetical protein